MKKGGFALTVIGLCLSLASNLISEMKHDKQLENAVSKEVERQIKLLEKEKTNG